MPKFVVEVVVSKTYVVEMEAPDHDAAGDLAEQKLDDGSLPLGEAVDEDSSVTSVDFIEDYQAFAEMHAA